MIRNSILTLTVVATASLIAFGASAQQSEVRIPGATSQAIVRDQQIRETRAPGTNREISTDTKETATGGQAGGIPGHN